MLAVERSLLTQIIAGTGESFTQGVTGIWEPGPFRFEVGFTDGINTEVLGGRVAGTKVVTDEIDDDEKKKKGKLF